MNRDADDVTAWIHRLHGGDSAAAEALWHEYFDRLVRVARRKFDSSPRGAADEEDAALSAMHSFYRGMKDGRYRQLADRDELWRLLVTIVVHKIYRQRRHDHAQKRGGGHVRGESVFLPLHDSDQGAQGIEQVMGKEPTPEFAAMIRENCDQLLLALSEEPLRQVARYKLEGFTNEEIAEKLDCTVRSVERKLHRIRAVWTPQADDADDQGE